MKKLIALSVCALLGTVAGYFAAPVAAVAVVQSSDPMMLWGSAFARVRAGLICECTNNPASASAKALSDHLATLGSIRANNPRSELLGQEMGLTYVRLSMMERKLDQQTQSAEDMKRGQAELSALGWRDVSESHLIYVVAQLSAEYQPANEKKDKNSSTVTATK